MLEVARSGGRGGREYTYRHVHIFRFISASFRRISSSCLLVTLATVGAVGGGAVDGPDGKSGMAGAVGAEMKEYDNDMMQTVTQKLERGVRSVSCWDQ